MRCGVHGAKSRQELNFAITPRDTAMLGWFQALMPREGRFFALFEKHAAIVVAGAEALRGLLQGGDSVEAFCQQIFQREAEADDVTREVLVAVRRTFITPFDRPDIQDLRRWMMPSTR
jgi:uncharacterized protein